MRYIYILLLALAPQAALADGCADESWAGYLAPGPQKFERREVIALSAEINIIAIEFGPLDGDFAKLFMFLEDNGTCYSRVVSVGSYAFTNEYAIERGGSRVYHIDLYEFESHSTLGMSETPPSYAQAREIALETLQ